MWFNNALVFHYELNQPEDFNDLLKEERLKPCPPHARFIYGWLPALAYEMVHDVAGSSMICMGKEERILPRGVIKKMLQERVQLIEQQQGRTVKRAEKAQIAEDLEFELLPKSFCVQKKQQALLDTINKRLIINTSSANQALQLTGLLRKSIPGMTIEPLTISENLALKFAQWINTPEVLPEDFQLASDCLLFSLHDEHKRIHCKGYELPSEEIVTLLAQDMATAEISLVWKERIQFTLTHDFVFKKLKSLDYLSDDFSELKELDEEYQRQDAALTLLSGELRALVDALNSLLTPNHQANEVTTEQQIPLLV